jgi:serine-aspartate repeat-containing protein C/D/E
MQHRRSPGLAACGDDGPESSATTAAPVATAPDSSAPTSAPESSAPATDVATTDAPATDAPSTEAGATTEVDDVTLDSGPSQEDAADALVGLTEDEAEEAAAEQGWTVRVVVRDGEDLPATMDFRPNRVNVEVTDDEVTEVVSIG